MGGKEGRQTRRKRRLKKGGRGEEIKGRQQTREGIAGGRKKWRKD